jgi:hypothetical protein
MQRLLNDELLSQKLSINARATAEKSTWLMRAKNILELLNERSS